MSTPTQLLQTLNGESGSDAQFEMLWAAISFKVKTEMAQVQVMGSGEVVVQPGTGGNESTMITTYD